jgi:hypothetical protein
MRRVVAPLVIAAVLAAGLTVTVPATGSSAVPPRAVAPATAMAGLDRAADTRPATVTGWHVEAGTLVVSVHGSANGVREWATGHGAGAVTIHHVAEAPRPFWDLIGGQLITSGGTRCTLGFNATAGTSRYILTAGHCIAAGSGWNGVGGYIGPSVSSSFPNNDYGLVRVTSTTAVSTPLVDRYSSGSDVTVTGVSAPPSTGSGICYSSPVGWRCGTVTGVNQTVCYAQGCVSGLISTTMCPQPGCSGASVVTNPGAGTTVRAVGLVSGGSGDCTSGGVTYVQPIAEPLSAYGLTLVTG